jgi:hypothetical protein
VNDRVEFHASGAAEIPGLPEAAFVALVDQLVKLGRDPWANSTAGLRDDQNFREVPFGDHGIAAVYIDESRRTVLVYEIVWAG